MWLNLCLLILLNSVDTKLRGFELKLKDTSAHLKTLKNPGLPYMARYTWKQKNTPKLLKPTKADNDFFKSKKADAVTNLWREVTTEISVPLGNVFNSEKYDHVGDYIKFLTKIKGKIRSKNILNIFKIHDVDSVCKSNIKKETNCSSASWNVSDTIMKRQKLVAVELTTKRVRKRFNIKSEELNMVDGSIDNTIDSFKPTKKIDNHHDDKDLIDNLKRLNDSKEYDNPKEDKTLRESDKFKDMDTEFNKRDNNHQEIEKNLTDSHKNKDDENKILDENYKRKKESDKYLKLSDKRLKGSYKEIEKSDKRSKEGDKELEYSGKYLKEIDKNIKEIVKDLKESAKKDENKLVSLKNIISSETVARLLASIQKNKPTLSDDVTVTSIPNITHSTGIASSRNCRNITKKYNKAVKFIIPKSEINNADAVFIVFRNLTSKNQSFYTDNLHDYNNKLFFQNKHREPEGLIFKPDNRKKISKLMLDGTIPDWLGTKIKQFKNKISKLNDAQKVFVTTTSLPLHRLQRSIVHGNVPMNTSKMLQEISNKLGTNRKPNFLYVMPFWQSNKSRKTRATRSSIFSRRYHSPNKFRITVRPVKRENKLGQIGVHIYREYEPLKDVENRLKQYYEILPSSALYENDTFQVSNTKSEPFIQPSDTDLEQMDDIGTYLGLNSNSMGNTFKSKTYIRKHFNVRKPCKHMSDPRFNEIECEDSKVENLNRSDQKENRKLNEILIPFSNTKHNDNEYDDTQSVDPVTKELSMLFPRSRRLVRDSKGVSDVITDHNAILIFTKSLLRKNKPMQNSYSYLSPHIDQGTLQENILNYDFPLTLNNRTTRLNKTANENKEKQVQIEIKPNKTANDHKPNHEKSQNVENEKVKENNEQPLKQNSTASLPVTTTAIITTVVTTENKGLIVKSLQIPQTLIRRKTKGSITKPYLQSRQQIGPVKNLIKRTPNHNINTKTRAKQYSYDKSLPYVRPKDQTLNRRMMINNFRSRNYGSYRNNNRNRSYDAYGEENIRPYKADNNSDTRVGQVDHLQDKKKKTDNTTEIIPQGVIKVKRSKKRELGSSSVFGQFFGDLSEDHDNEEMFNVDIGNMGQADMFEQLESSDEHDPELYSNTANNNNSLVHKHYEQLKHINRSKQAQAYNAHLDLKDTMWLNAVKKAKVAKKVRPSNRKHDSKKSKSTDNTNNINLYGYENLGTARKLYTDLDPVGSEDNSVTHYEKERGVKYNRAIHPSINLHPQLDDYNDEFLRDSNVDTNRIGVDYINYNSIGPGIDFSDYSLTKYDKYANFLGERNVDFADNLNEKNIKLSNRDVPNAQKWQKYDFNYNTNKPKKKETIKHKSSVKKPKRVHVKIDRTFDYMNLDETEGKLITDKLAKARKSVGKRFRLSTTLPTRLPKPAEVINQFYNQNEQRKKQQMQFREKSNLTRGHLRNERRKKKNQIMQKVYIHVEPTTEFFAKELLMKDLNVYIHKTKPIRKKNNLHNSKHLLDLWSSNHQMPTGNSNIAGVSPLDIWSHRSLRHPKPTPMEELLPEEEEFDRRKRDTTPRRSRLVCCVVKRPDQQDLVKHVKATWGRRCDVLIFITSKGAERHIIWEYTKAGLRFVYELHYKDADWILKADIDSYIVIENLRYMVKEYDPETPLYFGRLGLSDFSNFVLSKEALKNLITRSQESETCQGTSDEGIGYCLEYLGVKAVDSRDKLGRARFYPFSPFELNPVYKHSLDEGLSTWSDYAVAFGKVNYKDMYTLDYFLYRIQTDSASKEVLRKVISTNFTEIEETTFSRPPHSKKKMTENLINRFKFERQNNQSKRLSLDEFQDKVRQLKGLF